MIIPIGHDQTEVRRQPWVTFTIMGLCIAVHLLICFAPGTGETEVGEKLNQAVNFWMEHPYLEVPEILKEELLNGVPEEEFNTFRVLLEQNVGPPPVDSVIAEEQIKLEELVEKSFAGIGELPIFKYGLVPSRMTVLTLFTHMFLHVGWMHLLGNLFFLYLTGPFIEDVWGRPVFIAFYLLGGLASGGLFALRYADLTIPLVGASGAIAACMGAFLIRYWHINIKFFYWIGFFFRGTFKAPAWLMLPLWLLRELFAATMMDSFNPSGRSGGTAFWAHVWGFMFGAGIAFGIRMLKIEQRFIHHAIEAKTTVVNNAVVAEALEAQDEGRTDEAFASLNAEVQRNPGNSEAVLALWGMAIGASRVAEAVPALQRLLREEVRASEFDLAMTHRAELTEFAPDARVEPLVDLRLAEYMLKDEQGDQAAALLRNALDQVSSEASPGMLTRLARLGCQADPAVGLDAVELALAHPELPEDVREEFNAKKEELADRQPVEASPVDFGGGVTLEADGISIPGFESNSIVEPAAAPEPVPAVDQSLVPGVGGDAPVDVAALDGMLDMPGFETTALQDPAAPDTGATDPSWPTPVPPVGGDAPTADPEFVAPEPAPVATQGFDTAEESWAGIDPVIAADALTPDSVSLEPEPVPVMAQGMEPAEESWPLADPSIGVESLAADPAPLTAEPGPVAAQGIEIAEESWPMAADPLPEAAEPDPPAPDPAPVAAPAPGPASLRQPGTVPPSKKLELHQVEPLSIDGQRLTLDVQGRGPSALGLDKVQAVSSAVIRPAGRPAFIIIDLLLDPPWATSTLLRVVRMRSGRLEPAKLVPEAPNSAEALRMMIDKLLTVSQGIPLPDARAVKGSPFREFTSLKEYEREILQAG